VQMAVAASQLLQAPQDHLKNLSALLALARDADPEVRWLIRMWFLVSVSFLIYPC